MTGHNAALTFSIGEGMAYTVDEARVGGVWDRLRVGMGVSMYIRGSSEYEYLIIRERTSLCAHVRVYDYVCESDRLTCRSSAAMQRCQNHSITC